MCIEYNPYAPNHIIAIPPLDETQSTGASALALVELATKKGYQLVAATVFNLIFVANEEYSKLNIINNCIDVVKNTEKDFDNSWFMTYSGAIYNTSRVVSYELQKKDFESNQFIVKRRNVSS